MFLYTSYSVKSYFCSLLISNIVLVNLSFCKIAFIATIDCQVAVWSVARKASVFATDDSSGEGHIESSRPKQQEVVVLIGLRFSFVVVDLLLVVLFLALDLPAVMLVREWLTCSWDSPFPLCIFTIPQFFQKCNREFCINITIIRCANGRFYIKYPKQC